MYSIYKRGIKFSKLFSDEVITKIRKLKALLNKLTLEKFDVIYKNIINENVDTIEDIKTLVQLVFEKATTQHHFIPVLIIYRFRCMLNYALDLKLTLHRLTILHQELIVGEGRLTFIFRLLVDQCQESFIENLSPLEVPSDLSPEKQFEFELKWKHRMKGILIFVGELLKSTMLASKICLVCIDLLLEKYKLQSSTISSTSETGNHYLEALADFLQTVGPFFDRMDVRF